VLEHPQYDKVIFGFTELYSRTSTEVLPADELWQPESDIGKLFPAQWKRQITEVAICPTDPNYVYIVTLGQFNGGLEDWTLHSKLFMSHTGLANGNMEKETFYQLPYPGSELDSVYPVITGIAVNPLNPKKIWITFCGFFPQYKVWSYDGRNWKNEDPENSLGNLPVNALVYQEGTNDRLYIGTDAGIYVKDQSMNCWKKYGDFPNVRVVEMKINNCSGKIRAATFGRGVWEGNLLPDDGCIVERIIHGSVTWENKKGLIKNIMITRNAALTIIDTISMPVNGTITVEKMGTLLIDGGLITNNCGQEWQGITVMKHRKKRKQFKNGKVFIVNDGGIENAREDIKYQKKKRK